MGENPGSRQDVEQLIGTLRTLRGFAATAGDPQGIAQLDGTIAAWETALAADGSATWTTCATCGGPIGSRQHCQHVAIEELVAS
jgi:hypothetical protein